MGLTIICLRPDRSRAVGSVPHIYGIIRVAIIVGGINPMDIVHPTVVVIVDGVVGNLVHIHPHLVSQIDMGVSHTSINDRHDDLPVAGCNVPRLIRINIRIIHTAILPIVEQAPQTAILICSITR